VLASGALIWWADGCCNHVESSDQKVMIGIDINREKGPNTIGQDFLLLSGNYSDAPKLHT
jgi:hypothetical protein